MFFYIGNECPIKQLNQVEEGLFLDQGWACKDGIWYKGYSTECKLIDNLNSIILDYKPAGKYCVIKNKKLYFPELRGFPLFEKDGNLTNLELDGYKQISYDIGSAPNLSTISLDEAAEKIGDLLKNNIVNFLSYNNLGSRLNVLFSGGLDTLTAWAVLDKVYKNYNLNVYLTKPHNRTPEPRAGRVREYNNDLTKLTDKNWGYAISSVYGKYNWYLTGFYAEVMTFRDIAAIKALANYQQKNIDEICQTSDYLYYFLKKSLLELHNDKKLNFVSEQDLKSYLWTTFHNDFQMWHLNNNMTFSPFYNLEIPSIMYRLSVDDITQNAITGIIQKKIIERFNPAFLKLLSQYKKENNIWINFRKYFSTIKLDAGVKVFIT